MMSDTATEKRDFFISYTVADQAWAEWIAWQLERAGYSTVSQAWDFRPGNDFIHTMRLALDSSTRTIAVLSPSYLVSRFGESEWRATFAKDPSGELGLLLPVRVQDCQLPDLLATRAYIDLAGLDEKAAAARLLDAVSVLRERTLGRGRPPFPAAATDPPAEPPYPGRGPAVVNLPPRNPYFIGRVELLEQLRNNFYESAGHHTSAVQAICGLGGVGKTQLALEFAHRNATNFDLVWWVPGETPMAITSGLSRLGSELGVPQDIGESVRSVLDKLRQRDRWLLVLDNVINPPALAPYLPQDLGGGHIIVTSRDSAWASIGVVIQLDVFRRSESIAFLRRRIGAEEKRPIAQLAEELGDLPLALEQAAAFIRETSIPLGEYLQLLQRHQDLMFESGPEGFAMPWQLSLDEVARTAPAAVDLLNLCAFLAPEVIPLDIFLAAPGVLPEGLERVVQDRLALDDTVSELRRYSLLDRDRAGVRVHRLVQAVIRQNLTSEEQEDWIERGIKLLKAAWPDEASSPHAWSRSAQLLPHIVVVAKHAQQQSAALEATVALLNSVGGYFLQRGLVLDARTVFDQALTIAQGMREPHHKEIAGILTNLGLVERSIGEPAAARDRLSEALAVLEGQLGPDHPDVARSLNSLGIVLRDLGDLPAARDAHQRALAVLEGQLGPDHPDVARSLNSLGIVLRDLGDLPAARDAHQRAVVILEARLGPSHPTTATSLANLGRDLRQLGDLTAARHVLERALAIHETQLGPDHPDVSKLRIDLAELAAPGERPERP